MSIRPQRFFLWGVVFVIFFSGYLEARDVRISTFNIRWYGANSGTDEFRDTYIKKFIDKELHDVDVLVLQEIVDVQRLQKNIMGKDMQCRTYKQSSSGHQHVVVCHRPWFRFDREPDDNDYQIEKVSTAIGGKARPGLIGLLKDRFGNPLIHIIGVHLKAFPHETAKRVKQLREISKRIKSLEVDVPVVVVGDYNTHYAELTGYDDDDEVIVDRLFKSYDLGMYQVYNRYKYTYRVSDGGNRFDHFWVTGDAQVSRRLEVANPCGSATAKGKGFNDVEYYNHYVSDHCPVTVSLDVGKH